MKRPYKNYFNNEPMDVVPPWVLEKMSDRLGRVVSLYFSQHPDEYEKFLKSRENKKISGEEK